MAMTGVEQPKPLPEPAGHASEGSGAAPSWIFALYLTGLVLVFVGERVLSGLERGSGAVTALGVFAVLVATALRFSPRLRRGGERKAIESVLAILSLLGVLALCVYFATTDKGAALFRLTRLTSSVREHLFSLLRVAWIALVAVSVVPMLFAETALWQMRRAERPESRRVRAAATAGLTLVLAAIYGSLLVYAAGGLPWKVDYSYFKTSLPSTTTKKLAASLDEPIKVVAFFPNVNEVRSEVKSYLAQLSAGIPKLQVTITDRLLAPKLARDLRASRDGQLILARGSETYTLDLGTDIEAARPKLRTLDRDFRAQLIKLARARMTAYLTVGHGELDSAQRPGEGRSASIARALLQRQNFQVKDLGLSDGLSSDVPADADIVLVLGPSEPFSSSEIASLQRYADRGGHLFMALDPDVSSVEGALAANPHAALGSPKPAASAAPVESANPAPAHAQLEELAKIAGLSLSPNILANERNHVRVAFNDSDVTRMITNIFSSHASVSTLSQHASRAAVVVFGSGSLERAPGSSAKVDFSVRASSGTFADKNRDFHRDATDEPIGSFNLAAAVTEPIKDASMLAAKPEPKPEPKGKDKDKASKKPETKEMRAFVTADADAFTDLVMSNVIGNQVLFLDAVRWLVGEESFAGQETSEEDVRIEHTKQQDLSWFYATIFGAPAIVLGAGVFVSRRSRRPRGGRS